VTTEHFEHQAHLRLVSEHPIWVCLSAYSILGDSCVPTFPNTDINLKFYYYVWLETMETVQNHLTVFRTLAPPTQLTDDAALTAYKKKTKQSLRMHPLMDQLNTCDPQLPAPEQILKLLHAQVNQITPGNDRFISWLGQIVTVLSVSSSLTRKVIGAVNPIRMILLQSNL
jgi:hypothetical protein